MVIRENSDLSGECEQSTGGKSQVCARKSKFSWTRARGVSKGNKQKLGETWDPGI